MARSVGWTERAWSDLERAAEYITEGSPSYAATLLAGARDVAASLDRFPERGRIVPEFGEPEIRELFVGSYRLIYRVGNDRIDVLAFIHGARDLDAAWQRPAP